MRTYEYKGIRHVGVNCKFSLAGKRRRCGVSSILNEQLQFLPTTNVKVISTRLVTVGNISSM